jgi:prolyl-tRNA synthetase
MSVRRDTRAKEAIPLAMLPERLPALLDSIQADLLAAARRFRDENTVHARTPAELEAHFAERRGFVALPWNDDDKLEAAIKEKTGATLRCVPLDPAIQESLSQGAGPVALFARAY